MNRWYLSLLVVALPAVVLAQYSSSQYRESTPYQPAVPPPSINMGYGGYGYNTGASTAAGSAMNGMANAISAKGNYNLSTSAAAINMTQAQRNEIQNHQMYEDTYFQMRSQNEAWQKAHQKPTPTQEQMARWAREEAPQPLNPKQVDQSGNLNWPPALQEDVFATQRTGLEQLMAKKTAGGQLSISEQLAARQTIEDMFAQLKTQIRVLPTSEYAAARSFLRSLIYATAHSDLT